MEYIDYTNIINSLGDKLQIFKGAFSDFVPVFNEKLDWVIALLTCLVAFETFKFVHGIFNRLRGD